MLLKQLSSISTFFPQSLRQVTDNLNVPFLFLKIPLTMKINSFPSDISSSDVTHLHMPFNLGISNRNLSQKNLPLFNRILFLNSEFQFSPCVGWSQSLVWLGLASLPLGFANRLKNIKFDCVRLSGLPIIVKSFILNTPLYHSIRVWDLGSAQDLLFQQFLTKVTTLAVKRNKIAINLQFIKFCKSKGIFLPKYITGIKHTLGALSGNLVNLTKRIVLEKYSVIMSELKKRRNELNDLEFKCWMEFLSTNPSWYLVMYSMKIVEGLLFCASVHKIATIQSKLDLILITSLCQNDRFHSHLFYKLAYYQSEIRKFAARNPTLSQRSFNSVDPKSTYHFSFYSNLLKHLKSIGK